MNASNQSVLPGDQAIACVHREHPRVHHRLGRKETATTNLVNDMDFANAPITCSVLLGATHAH